MSQVLTRGELDKMQCGNPTCHEDHGPLIFHSRCHIDTPTWAEYEDGVLTVRCAACDATVARVQVSGQEAPTVLTELTMTCSACPSQWEGKTEDGRYFYARYRWGSLTWGFGETADKAIDCSMGDEGGQVQAGDALDGVMSTGEMVKHVNLIHS